MNLFGSAVGAVPMCHGAGGMAGHVAFGARTGGSVIILGTLLLVLALGFSGSVMTLFGLVPMALLGTILVVTGWQLGAGQDPAAEGCRRVAAAAGHGGPERVERGRRPGGGRAAAVPAAASPQG